MGIRKVSRDHPRCLDYRPGAETRPFTPASVELPEPSPAGLAEVVPAAASSSVSAAIAVRYRWRMITATAPAAAATAAARKVQVSAEEVRFWRTSSGRICRAADRSASYTLGATVLVV